MGTSFLPVSRCAHWNQRLSEGSGFDSTSSSLSGPAQSLRVLLCLIQPVGPGLFSESNLGFQARGVVFVYLCPAVHRSLCFIRILSSSLMKRLNLLNPTDPRSAGGAGGLEVSLCRSRLGGSAGLPQPGRSLRLLVSPLTVAVAEPSRLPAVLAGLGEAICLGKAPV